METNLPPSKKFFAADGAAVWAGTNAGELMASQVFRPAERIVAHRAAKAGGLLLQTLRGDLLAGPSAATEAPTKGRKRGEEALRYLGVAPVQPPAGSQSRVHVERRNMRACASPAVATNN